MKFKVSNLDKIQSSRKRIAVLLIAIVVNYTLIILSKLLFTYCIDDDSVFAFKDNMFENLSIVQIIISLVILAPLYEEALYRAWIELDNRSIFISIVTLFYLIADFLFIKEFWILRVVIIYLIISFIILFKFTSYRRLFKTPSNKLKWILLLFTAILFSVSHIFRYEHISLITALLCLPQFFNGIILGYLRYKNGLFSAIILHFSANLGLAIIVFC